MGLQGTTRPGCGGSSFDPDGEGGGGDLRGSV